MEKENIPGRNGENEERKTADFEPRSLEVGAAVIVQNGRILIAQRREGDSYGGFWEFPGGKRKPGENMPECLRRELMEELGIEAEAGKLWKIVEYASPERILRLHFYFCRITGGEPAALGCQACRWVAPGELRNFRFPPADLEIIAELSGL
ncbi:MAG TPA: 8-oxo-dGTP diphosphatase MutT [Candidatus Omnitrophota bacterium]|nr:8-oxo-dGTP diphosphatase MutT [Candidatus Omnitrophota bacterium]